MHDTAVVGAVVAIMMLSERMGRRQVLLLHGTQGAHMHVAERVWDMQH